MNKITLILAIIVLSTSSCSMYHLHSDDISTDYYPSKDTPSKIVYLENVDQPHEVIGFVTVNTERRQRVSEVIEKMKFEAAVIGADAITNIQSDATGDWKKLPVQKIIGNAYVRANFQSSAIVFK